MTAPNVPFPRALVYGQVGADVIAHKRALARAFPDIYQWDDFTALFGRAFLHAVGAAQHRMGIAPSGKIGAVTHEALERRHRAGHPKEWSFDRTAIQLATDFAREFNETPEDRKRRQTVDFAMLTHALRDYISYSQRRPFVGPPPLEDRVQSWIDCSGFVTDACEAGGLPDPNGRGYDRQGYTGTIVGGTVPTTKASLKKGDIVMYGFTTSSSGAFPYGSPTHTALYVGGGYVVSMGSSVGPSYLPLNYRRVNDRTPFRTHRL